MAEFDDLGDPEPEEVELRDGPKEFLPKVLDTPKKPSTLSKGEDK